VTPLPTVCFVSWEIHPTTFGGCGVLLHHASEILLERGHRVVFLLDLPSRYFVRFRDVDRLQLPRAEHCSAFHVDELCADFPWTESDIASPFQWKALRFAHALAKVVKAERVDFVEFFEYCGVGCYTLARKLYGEFEDNVLAVRLHNSIEWIDRFEATKPLTLPRYVMYALERAALQRAETVLAPTRTYAQAYYVSEYGLDERQVVVSQSPRRPFPKVERPQGGKQDEILYFGRVFQFKGVDKLVQASILLFEKRPGLRLRVVLMGQDSRESPEGGSHVAYLQKLVPEHLASRFEFTGQLSHEQAAQRFQRSLFAVFPNEFESFCYALHEVYHSGIPVIIADLPGFRDFFTHERNALVFNGSIDGLVAAMERMIDDPALRARLSLPYPVAEEPLGTVYAEARAFKPIRHASGKRVQILTLVLVRDDEEGALRTTLDALPEADPRRELRVVVLGVAGSGGRTPATLPFLGETWNARDLDGGPVDLCALESREALWILEAGDRPSTRFLDLVQCAFDAGPDLSFAGGWLKSGARVQPSTLDITPEIQPFRWGTMPTRTVVRTASGRALVDLFDYRAGALGEIDYLWSQVDRLGPGCLFPEALVEVPSVEPRAAPPQALAYLVMKQTDPERLKRLARFSTVRSQDATASEPPSRRAVKRLALQALSGSTLLKLAVRKWVRSPGKDGKTTTHET